MCQQKGNVSNFTLLPLTLADSETLQSASLRYLAISDSVNAKNDPKNTFRCLTE